jgi:hypothetical protein
MSATGPFNTPARQRRNRAGRITPRPTWAVVPQRPLSHAEGGQERLFGGLRAFGQHLGDDAKEVFVARHLDRLEHVSGQFVGHVLGHAHGAALSAWFRSGGV